MCQSCESFFRISPAALAFLHWRPRLASSQTMKSWLTWAEVCTSNSSEKGLTAQQRYSDPRVGDLDLSKFQLLCWDQDFKDLHWKGEYHNQMLYRQHSSCTRSWCSSVGHMSDLLSLGPCLPTFRQVRALMPAVNSPHPAGGNRSVSLYCIATLSWFSKLFALSISCIGRKPHKNEI